MRRRGRRVAALVLVAGIVVLGAAAFLARDTFRDMWAIRQLESEDVEVRERARLELVARRSVRGLPHVLRMIRDDSRCRDLLRETLAAYGARARAEIELVAEFVDHDADPVREVVLKALAREGLADEAAAPAVARALGDASMSIRESAEAALRSIGRGPRLLVPALAEVCETEGNVFIVQWAFERLLAHGADAATVAPVLERVVEAVDSPTRLVVVQALARVVRARRDDAFTVDVLKVALDASDENVRAFAATFLEDAGDAAERAVDELAASLAQVVELDETRGAVLRTLGSLGPRAERALPALLELLRRHNGRLNGAIAYAISRLGAIAVEPLAAIVRDAGHPGRAIALRALGMIGPPARDAVRDMARCLDGAGQPVLSEAVLALSALGPAAAGAIPELVEWLRAAGESQARFTWFGVTLANIGEPAVDALVALVGSTGDETTPTAVFTTIARIGPRARDAVPVLIERLRRGEGRVPQHAARALASIGEDAHEAVPMLEARVRDRDGTWPELWAVDALGEFGPEARAAVPTLQALLASAVAHPQGVTVACRTARALWRITRDAALVVPSLVAVLHSCGPRHASYPLSVLEEIGPPAALAAPAVAASLLSGASPDAVAECFRAIAPGIDSEFDPGFVREFGAASGVTVASLVQALDSDDATQRDAALAALAAVGPRAAPAVERVVALLGERQLARRAASVLRRIGPAVAPFATAIVRALNDTGSADLAYALGSCGPAIREVLPELESYLDDGRPQRLSAHVMRAAVAAAVLRIDDAASEAKRGRMMRVIVTALEDRSKFAVDTSQLHGGKRRRYTECQEVADVVRDLGPLADRATLALRQACRSSEDAELRRRAALALLAVSEGGRTSEALRAIAATDRARAVETLIELAETDNEMLRGRPAADLGALGEEAAAAIPALVKAAATRRYAPREYLPFPVPGQGGDEVVHHARAAAITALARIGAALDDPPPTIRETIETLLDDPERAVREAAREALGER